MERFFIDLRRRFMDFLFFMDLRRMLRRRRFIGASSSSAAFLRRIERRFMLRRRIAMVKFLSFCPCRDGVSDT